MRSRWWSIMYSAATASSSAAVTTHMLWTLMYQMLMVISHRRFHPEDFILYNDWWSKEILANDFLWIIAVETAA